MTSGAELRQLRIDCGLTKADVAREVGITRTAVADSEKARKVQVKTLERYMTAFAAVAKRNREERHQAQLAALLELVVDTV